MPYEDREHAAQAVRRETDLTLENRRKLTVTGVEEVESFDEREIVMRTAEGSLTVRGEELNVSRLSVEHGDVLILGHIGELRYDDRAPERSLWARLFG